MLKLRRTQPSIETDGSLLETWWRRRTSDGITVGVKPDEVWITRLMPPHSQVWEDDSVRFGSANENMRLFDELALTIPQPPGNITALEQRREFWIMSVRLYGEAVSPSRNHPDLSAYQRENLLAYQVPRKADFVSIKLRASGETAIQKATRFFGDAFTEDVDLSPWSADYADMHRLLASLGATIPTDAEWEMLDGWYSGGNGTRERLVEAPSGKKLHGEAFGDGIEISAVTDPRRTLQAPDSSWMNETFIASSDVIAVSIRGEVQRQEIAMKRLRDAQRKAVEQHNERLKSADSIVSDDDQVAAQLASEVEAYMKQQSSPLLVDTSILIARQATKANRTFREMLRSNYAIDSSVLVHQQHAGLVEMTMCAPNRVGKTTPTRQTLFPEFVADSGWRAGATASDTHGIMLGWAIPEYTPIYLDPRAASTTEDASASMLIIGDSGSGKTLTMLDMATQGSLDGHVIFLNPKPADDLSPVTEMVSSWGVPARTIAMEAVEPGSLDPAGYARNPETATNTAAEHILSVIVDFSDADEALLTAGLRQGFREGARCVGDALQHVESKKIRERVMLQVEAEPKFAVGISMKPVETAQMEGDRSFTLIQFDESVEPPTSESALASISVRERVALAQMRIVNRFAMELLLKSSGGQLYLDELWRIVSSPYGRQAVSTFSREGRSQGILPVYGTQSLSDLLRWTDDKFAGLFSRVLGLYVKEAEEQQLLLQMVGLEDTPARRSFISTANPKRPNLETGFAGESGKALYRDIRGAHTALQRGPFPESLLLWLSTNLADRKKRASGAFPPPSIPEYGELI